jgi:hypothetical protein
LIERDRIDDLELVIDDLGEDGVVAGEAAGFLREVEAPFFGALLLGVPPPTLIGLRMPPVRALPVPFCLNILRSSRRLRRGPASARCLALVGVVVHQRLLEQGLFTSPPSLASSTWTVRLAAFDIEYGYVDHGCFQF